MGQITRFRSEIHRPAVKMKAVMGSLSIRKCAGLAAAALVVGLVLQFQNCSKNSSNSQSSDSQHQQQVGGGGYDGKTFADLSLQLCDDKSYIRDRAVIENNQAKFVRENCRDLAPSEIHVETAAFSGQDAQSGGMSLHLESVPPEKLGEFTTSELGDYAPAIAKLDLGSTVYFRAIPLGADRVLAFTADNFGSPMILRARLYQRNGMFLTETASWNQSITVVQPGDSDNMNPLAMAVPVGGDQAAVFLEQSVNQYKVLPFQTTANSILHLDANDISISAAQIGAQKLDDTRALLWLRRASDSNFAFRILHIENGVMTLGPENSGTGAPFSVGASKFGPPAFLPGATEGSFYVAIQNDSGLAIFTLQITGDTVAYNSDYAPLNVQGLNPAAPVFAGSSGDGYLLYSAAIDFPGDPDVHDVLGPRWVRFSQGTLGTGGAINDAFLIDYVSDPNPAGAANLLINNHVYFNGSRIRFLSPDMPGPKHFTSESYRAGGSVFQNSELFGSSNKLIGIGVANGFGFLTVLSVPY